MTTVSRPSVGIRSLALGMPATVRSNDYWRTLHPDVVASAERSALARVFTPRAASARTASFDREMAPYLDDPFRGSIERRVIGAGEKVLPLEVKAARDALAAARLDARDVDLLICCSFIPDQLDTGNAPYLCAELGLTGTAWNLESTCSSALQALHVASALVRAGEYRNVLVVASVNYSKIVDERDTLAWNSGDGAVGFVIGAVSEGAGFLGFKSLHTASTCGAFHMSQVVDGDGVPAIRMGAGPEASRLLREVSEPMMRECCLGAASAAGVVLDDIAYFVLPTPTAWYASFCARVLGVDPARTGSVHGLYCNVGPVLPGVNLYHAALAGRVREGDLVLVATIGSVSSAAAAVMRWGEVALGPAPVR